MGNPISYFPSTLDCLLELKIIFTLVALDHFELYIHKTIREVRQVVTDTIKQVFST